LNSVQLPSIRSQFIALSPVVLRTLRWSENPCS